MSKRILLFGSLAGFLGVIALLDKKMKDQKVR